MSPRIYLDHAATTPLRPEAWAAMEPFLGAESFGNPSSQHQDGQRARRALDSARDELAACLGAEASEITFTSGGTEADNLALFGTMYGNLKRGSHLITTSIEHHAVLNTARFLETAGFAVTYVAPDSEGRIDAESIRAAIRPQTTLISVMYANNEVGTIEPVAEISSIAREHGVLFHTDAVQAFGQISVIAGDLGADLISLSAHKIYGPKGAGALYVRRDVSIEPLLHGGGQERDRRGGTENVAAIVGFAAAARLAVKDVEEVSIRLSRLRDSLLNAIRAATPSVVLNGSQDRLPNNLNVSFPGLDAEALLLNLDLAGISASSGSACSSGSIEPSHVLLAMDLPDDRVRSAIRFSLGRETTDSEIKTVVETLSKIVDRMEKTG